MDLLAEILNKNAVHRRAMLELIASKEAIAFVGAGLSAPCGYPPWKELLQKLSAEAGNIGPFQPPAGITESNPLDYAEALQRHFEKINRHLNRYYASLGRAFSELPCSLVQRRFVQLPFKGYVTTNYDGSLESALAQAGNKLYNCRVVVKYDGADAHKVSEFLMSLDDQLQGRRVAHIHGVADDTKHIILSKSDYERAYGIDGLTSAGSPRLPIWTFHRRLVWSLLATRRLIFFGCSLEDPYVNALLEAVADDLWNHDQCIHYAVTALAPSDLSSADAKESQLRYRYGLQLVYYDNQDEKHSGLDQLISEALGRCGTPLGLDWLESVNNATSSDPASL